MVIFSFAGGEKERKRSLSWNDWSELLRKMKWFKLVTAKWMSLRSWARVALTGLTVAECPRDQEGQDVLFFVDILDLSSWIRGFGFVRKNTFGGWYQPTLATDRQFTGENNIDRQRSITSVQAIVFLQMTLLTQPCHFFSHLDTTTVLSDK